MTKDKESPLKVLSDEPYVRQRLSPSPFERDYLHLADLAALIRKVAPTVLGTVFDYGSGGAPYFSFFSQCTGYVAADLEPGPKVHRVLRPNGLTNETSGTYDFVLSTQVLEHVQDPVLYLQECRRILRPGGSILLTTHGMVIEHGCPHDYQRWTARGLEELFLKSGFEIIRSGKLTTQIRGIVQLMNTFVIFFRHPKRRFVNIALSVIRKIYFKAFMPLLNKFADLFSEQTVVDGAAPDSIYVAVFVHARNSGH